MFKGEIMCKDTHFFLYTKKKNGDQVNIPNHRWYCLAGLSDSYFSTNFTLMASVTLIT